MPNQFIDFLSSNVATTRPANPFSTVSNVKDEETAKRLAQLLKDFDALRTGGQASVADFTARMKETDPAFKNLTSEDIAAAGDYFDGTIANALEKLRTQRKGAVTGATQRALGDLRRLLGLERLGMTGGGAQAAGTGSYLTKLALDKTAELQSQAGLDEASQARADLAALETAKLGLLGKRPDLLNTFAARPLLPLQAQSDFYSKLAQQLSALLSSNLANTFYGVGKQVGNT